MLFLIPKKTPALDTLLADLGNPRPKQIAKALGVSERTVWRWLESGDAPRPALLALFWVTSWGHSQVNARAVEGEVMYRGYVEALQRECRALRAQLAKVGRLGDFGSSNDPAPGVVPVANRAVDLAADPTGQAETTAMRKTG